MSVQGVRPQSYTLWFNFTPLKSGNLAKVYRKEIHYLSLKKFPPIFVGGLLMKILGYTNLKKKSQKREFSLGNIGKTPKT